MTAQQKRKIVGAWIAAYRQWSREGQGSPSADDLVTIARDVAGVELDGDRLDRVLSMGSALYAALGVAA